MLTIEELAAAFESLLRANNERWNFQSLVADRLHISRGPNGEYAVFIEGDRDSFGKLPPLVGLEHSTSVVSVPGNRKLSALRITSGDATFSSRVMAHIAYELGRRLEIHPSLDNAALFAQVEWVLQLLGVMEGVLATERQRGLVGECLLLRRLLILGRSMGMSANSVLQRWWGHSPSRRDFAVDGIAIEVKTTSASTRQHHINSIEQLDPQSPGEKVYLYSLGIRSDATVQKKLPHFVADVEAQILRADGQQDVEGIETFRDQLVMYGYQAQHMELYLGAPGYMNPHLAPEFYAEPTLDRVRLDSFKSNALPAMVVGVAYTLDVTATPLSPNEVNGVLTTFLASQPVTYQQA